MLWWTLGVAVVMTALVVAVSFYLTTVLVAREELDEATLGITIAALAFSLAVTYVMLLPLEVALQKEGNAAVTAAMEWAWPVALVLCLVFVCTLVPFGMTWYESLDSADTDDGVEADRPSIATEARRPWRKAGWVTVIVDFVLVAVFFLLWLAIGIVSVTDGGGKSKEERVPLSFFLVALTTAAGWSVFFVFCGVGFAAVPIEGMRAFVNRPRAVSAAEYEMTRARIHSTSQRLLETGRALDAEIGTGNPNRSQRRRLVAFRQQVDDLEKTHASVEAAYRMGNTSVIRQYAKLFLSICATLLSVLWILHMILYNLAHAHPFLNTLLVVLDDFLPLLGSGVYAVMALYLMWCTVVGCMTVGGNLLAFPIFPMRRGATMVNALLFNAMLTVLAAMAALHHCATSFDAYAKGTHIAAVFTRYVDRIAGVSQVVHYLPYALVVLSMVSVLWLLTCPKRRRASAEDDSDEENPFL